MKQDYITAINIIAVTEVLIILLICAEKKIKKILSHSRVRKLLNYITHPKKFNVWVWRAGEGQRGGIDRIWLCTTSSTLVAVSILMASCSTNRTARSTYDRTTESINASIDTLYRVQSSTLNNHLMETVITYYATMSADGTHTIDTTRAAMVVERTIDSMVEQSHTENEKSQHASIIESIENQVETIDTQSKVNKDAYTNLLLRLILTIIAAIMVISVPRIIRKVL